MLKKSKISEEKLHVLIIQDEIVSSAKLGNYKSSQYIQSIRQLRYT